ncbi:extracellular matrix regulator RemB [Salisediminibacterium beveridgei]|uniref:DUF370 domain-containing protein n=1 Tax=Salisediminibacterium beveridgei TaxID=632773 RepID=A0A1D7R094_9BACI|nr:extracellular matrix/biofilm biosynthesis regulator RemA family protein [Salisediminibacterium beveridgei]AOM84671.1 hypothetical protein BBEV_3380 [Salisediminibacterium beveridgei]
MFIHLGGDFVLKTERIIAIFDHQTQGFSKENQLFMEGYQGKKRKVHVSDDPPKSMVVTDDEIFMSPISTHTLKRRADASSSKDELREAIQNSEKKMEE